MEPVVETTNSTRDILIALGITLLIILAVCLILFWPKKEVSLTFAKPTNQVVTVPSPTPVTITVSVLNGSGVVGAAGTAAERLKAAGFDVTNIGNADRQTYKKTKIISKLPLSSKLLQALGLTSDQVDFATGSGDITEIILGKN